MESEKEIKNFRENGSKCEDINLEIKEDESQGNERISLLRDGNARRVDVNGDDVRANKSESEKYPKKKSHTKKWT